MRDGRRNGFTLLEMLVALVVFGLLMAGLSQTIRYGLTAWAAEGRAAAEPEALAAADGALRQLIEQAAPTGFAGRTDRVTFTTTLPAGSGLADRLADVTIALAPGQRLVLLWTPHPAGVPLGPPAAPRVEPLLDNLRGLRITYLTPQTSGSPVWADRWLSDGLPLLVRFSFVFTGSTGWPDIVAAPLARD